MEASNHFIIKRFISAAGQLRCDLFGQQVMLSFSEVQFLLRLLSLNFGITL